MVERRVNRFPEKWLAYSLAVAFTGTMYCVSIQLGVVPMPEEYMVEAFQALTAIGFAFVLVFFVLCSLVWAQRRELIRGVREIIKDTDFSRRSRIARRPAYLLANSVDREILAAISSAGGDIDASETLLIREALVPSTEAFQKSLAKLIVLGLVYPPSRFPLYRVFLTPRGLDALNAPASLFVSDVPDKVWQYVFQMKVKLSEENWHGVAVAMSSALEGMLKHEIEVAIEKEPSLQAMSKRKKAEDVSFERWPAGDLKGALVRMGALKRDSFEFQLVTDLITVRNKIHPSKNDVKAQIFGPLEAARCDLYMDLLLQSFYGPR